MHVDSGFLSASTEERGQAKIRWRVREIFSHVALIRPSSQGKLSSYFWITLYHRNRNITSLFTSPTCDEYSLGTRLPRGAYDSIQNFLESSSFFNWKINIGNFQVSWYFFSGNIKNESVTKYRKIAQFCLSKLWTLKLPFLGYHWERIITSSLIGSFTSVCQIWRDPEKIAPVWFLKTSSSIISKYFVLSSLFLRNIQSFGCFIKRKSVKSV